MVAMLLEVLECVKAMETKTIMEKDQQIRNAVRVMGVISLNKVRMITCSDKIPCSKDIPITCGFQQSTTSKTFDPSTSTFDIKWGSIIKSLPCEELRLEVRWD